MNDEQLTRLEEKLAYQEQAIQELNQAVYRQQREIDALREHNALLADRVAVLKEGGEPEDTDEAPPHY